MPTVTYVGPDSYSSTDPETGQSIVLGPGEEAEVSEAKAEQMLADFPAWFKGASKPSPPDNPSNVTEPRRSRKRA